MGERPVPGVGWQELTRSECLLGAGVAAAEADGLLDVIAARAAWGRPAPHGSAPPWPPPSGAMTASTR